LVEAKIKHARENIRIPLTGFDSLIEDSKGKEIQSKKVRIKNITGQPQ